MNWIFQSNPKYFDLPAAVAELTEIAWLVKQYSQQITVGDTVYFWESGGDKAGIVAVGHVLAEPAMLPGNADQAFQRDPGRFQSEALRVWVRIDHVLPKRILRKVLLNDSLLKDLSILRWSNATNFRVTDEQAAALEKMISS